MVIPREPEDVSSNEMSDGRRRDYTQAPQITCAYLLGVIHDATERHTTIRIASKNLSFCKILQKGINNLGSNAWIYKEGKSRDVYITEFSKKLLLNVEVKSRIDKINYIRGYFDAEGGIAKSPNVRFYIYFAQKNKKDLEQVKKYLTDLGISCGMTHNPSRRVDPNYFRFFIRAKSYRDFAKIIDSAHPDKQKLLRMKI
jgi:hypothetical protein